MATETINLAQAASVTKEAGGFLASAWSAAAEAYQAVVTAAQATGVLSAMEKQQILAAELATKMEQAASNAATWAEAAAARGERGVGAIMQKYSEKFAEQAAGLARDIASSEGALANTIADANGAIRAAESAGGNAIDKLAGPIVDAAQVRLNGQQLGKANHLVRLVVVCFWVRHLVPSLV